MDIPVIAKFDHGKNAEKVVLYTNITTRMDKTIIIISLLPCIFMIHEFEEIIGMKAWLKRNEAWLSKKIPRFSRKIQRFSQVSVPAFALAVLEEFLIVSAATFTALAFQWYHAWIAVFTTFYGE